jgi:aminoglycoside phosphotransferase family enzyme
MDLRYAGKRGLAERFVETYIECSGDEGLRGVADFYLCYRALVRLLVEALFLADPAIGASRKTRARRASRRYLALAEAFARRRSSGDIRLGPRSGFSSSPSS